MKRLVYFLALLVTIVVAAASIAIWFVLRAPAPPAQIGYDAVLAREQALIATVWRDAEALSASRPATQRQVIHTNRDQWADFNWNIADGGPSIAYVSGYAEVTCRWIVKGTPTACPMDWSAAGVNLRACEFSRELWHIHSFGTESATARGEIYDRFDPPPADVPYVHDFVELEFRWSGKDWQRVSVKPMQVTYVPGQTTAVHPAPTPGNRTC